jgi:hypothetical protein
MNVASKKLGRSNRVSPGRTKKSPDLGQSKRLQTARPVNYENREEIVVYQQNATTIFRGKHTIFELTHMVKAASCRPYPEKLSGL